MQTEHTYWVLKTIAQLQVPAVAMAKTTFQNGCQLLFKLIYFENELDDPQFVLKLSSSYG